jgi:RNA methyltransferase, TrmH family
MIAKALIKHIVSLQKSKFREEFGEFIAEGEKVVDELLRSHFHMKYLCALPDWLDKNHALVETVKEKVTVIGYHELERISALVTPNQVLAVFEIPKQNETLHLSNDDLILLLNDIRDPGNLGSIVRTADWFGIRKVICSLNSVDIYNPKTIQATMGSVARVHVTIETLMNLLNLPRPVFRFLPQPWKERIFSILPSPPEV